MEWHSGQWTTVRRIRAKERKPVESPRVSYIDRKARRLLECECEREGGRKREREREGVCLCACACVKISKENTFNKSLT